MKGQSGNPGGSSKKVREKYTLASIEGCPPTRWKAVVGALVAAALEGDVSAAAVLSKILPGALDAARVEVEAAVRPALPDLSRPGIASDLVALAERAFSAPMDAQARVLEPPPS